MLAFLSITKVTRGKVLWIKGFLLVVQYVCLSGHQGYQRSGWVGESLFPYEGKVTKFYYEGVDLGYAKIFGGMLTLLCALCFTHKVLAHL